MLLQKMRHDSLPSCLEEVRERVLTYASNSGGFSVS